MKIKIDLTAEQQAFRASVHKSFDDMLASFGESPQAVMMIEGMLLMTRAALPAPLLDELQEKLNALKHRINGAQA